MTRRVALTTVAVAVAVGMPGCVSISNAMPTCSPPIEPAAVLIAQSVPSATLLPCLEALPAGWSFSESVVERGSSRFWMDSTIAGPRAAEIELTGTCDTSGAVEIVPAPDEAGARVFQLPQNLDPFTGSRIVAFDGGCITYRYAFVEGAGAGLSLEVVEAISYLARRDVVDFSRDVYDQTLCGADAPPCES